MTTRSDPVTEKVNELISMLRIASSDVIFCAYNSLQDMTFVYELLKEHSRGISFRELHYRQNGDLAQELIKILKDSDFEVIEKYERRRGTVNIVFSVLGLEEIFDSRSIENLNVYRDLFLRLRYPVLIWINERDVSRLASEAPDFWRIRTKVFYFEEADILCSKANYLQEQNRYREALRYYDKALEINPSDVALLKQKQIVETTIGAISYKKRVLDNSTSSGSTKYVLLEYGVYFSEKLAAKYKPTVYANECLSGDPKAIYYRVISKNDTKEICIQYFFYWSHQNCMMNSHRYDYEPIFIYLKQDDSSPHLIVNGGLGGPECGFHKNEIGPKGGRRDRFVAHFEVKMSPKEFYPFGKDGNVSYKGCSQQYPLDGDDLQFKGLHPLFGIRACSNVFSGARHVLQGKRFEPSLERLTDEVLNRWYFNHYLEESDMPFGHDVADPFTYPHIKYHPAQLDLPKP